MKNFLMIAVSAACVLQAQHGQSYVRSFPLLRALDTDQNGVISAAEIAAAPESLRLLDHNQDGKLSAEECVENGEHGPSANDMVVTLMAFDKNGDGKLQRDELPERMRGLFDRGDLDKDGVLTLVEVRKLALAEQASQPWEPEKDGHKRNSSMMMGMIPVLAALDADHNGEISEEEIRNAGAALKTLDKNGDGRLTDDEVSPDWLRLFVAQRMLQFDTDGDGRVSREEMDSPKAAPFRATLVAADRNHDGFVTEEELLQEVRIRVDLNHDGVVSQEEIQRALQSGALAKPAVTKTPQEEVLKK